MKFNKNFWLRFLTGIALVYLLFLVVFFLYLVFNPPVEPNEEFMKDWTPEDFWRFGDSILHPM